MTYRELVESQSHESSIFTWHLLQQDSKEYARILSLVREKWTEEVPPDVLTEIRALSYP